MSSVVMMLRFGITGSYAGHYLRWGIMCLNSVQRERACVFVAILGNNSLDSEIHYTICVHSPSLLEFNIQRFKSLGNGGSLWNSSSYSP